MVCWSMCVTKTESNDAGHDLFGVDFGHAVDNSVDDVGSGFDNGGEAASTSPQTLEKSPSAAESLVEDSLVIADPPCVTKSISTGLVPICSSRAVNSEQLFRSTRMMTPSDGRSLAIGRGVCRVRAPLRGRRAKTRRHDRIAVATVQRGIHVRSTFNERHTRPDSIPSTFRHCRPGDMWAGGLRWPVGPAGVDGPSADCG
jgi:Protein of unknown function (DUF1587)